MTSGQPVLGVLTGVALVYALVRVARWARRESPLLAGIAAAGVLLRVTLGLLMYWVSAADLPVLRGVHSSDGYWNVAPDAREYFIRSARAAADGLGTVGADSASPAFVQVLALWMRLVGVSPLSGMFLNVTMYVFLCALLIYVWKPRGRWRDDLPCAVLLGSLTFAPALVAHGTQPLKDNMFTYLTALAGVGAFLTLRPVLARWPAVRSAWAPLAGSAMLVAAVWLSAGIRSYYAYLMLLSLGAVLLLFAAPWTRHGLRRSTPVAILLLALTAGAYAAGAGPFDIYLRPLFRSRAPVAAAKSGTVIDDIEAARAGFESSGGSTNVLPKGELAPASPAAAPPVTLPAAPPPPAPPAPSPVGASRLERTAIGLATFFVPMSLLRALSIVDIPIGRGVEVLADLDTLFIDVTLVASLVLLVRRWRIARRQVPYICFLLLLGGTTVLLMAYVVTNFGTMFRLRLMGVVPFWMLALAASNGRFMLETSTAVDDRVARASRPGPSDTPS